MKKVLTYTVLAAIFFQLSFSIATYGQTLQQLNEALPTDRGLRCDWATDDRLFCHSILGMGCLGLRNIAKYTPPSTDTLNDVDRWDPMNYLNPDSSDLANIMMLQILNMQRYIPIKFSLKYEDYQGWMHIKSMFGNQGKTADFPRQLIIGNCYARLPTQYFDVPNFLYNNSKFEVDVENTGNCDFVWARVPCSMVLEVTRYSAGGGGCGCENFSCLPNETGGICADDYENP